MLMVSIALVMAVIVTNVYLRKDSTNPVPQFIRRLFIRAPTTPYDYRRCPVHEAGRTPPAADPSKAGVACARTHNSTLQSGPQRRGSGSKNPARSSRCPDHVLEGRRQSLTDAERKEWQTLAKTVDRLFFWIFLAISVASLMVMYIRIPT